MASDKSLPGSGHRVWTGVRVHAIGFFREPLYLVLLVALPLLEIYFAGSALDSLPAAAFPSMETSLATTGRLFGAMYATAVFAGIVGLFQRLSAADADRRLIIAGSSPGRLFTTRFLTTLGITLLVATVATTGLVLLEDVARPALAFGALTLAGMVYAAIGMLLGSVLPRELEGSLALVLLVDIDVVLATGLLPTDLLVGELFPLFYPYQLFEAAVVGGEIDGGHALSAVSYLGVVGVAAAAVYVRSTAVDGGER